VLIDDASLHAALDDAYHRAKVCTRLCRLASKVNEHTFEVAHNGVGKADSDHQVVYSEAALELWTEPLSDLLATWIVGLHQGVKINLNTEVPPPCQP
jgi:hypothetical protein